MNTKILDKLHRIEKEILDEIVRICDKYELNYFLIGGTLLGAVRHKGFIPWDDDLDIAMPRADYNKLLGLCKHELKDGYSLDYYQNNKFYWTPVAKIRKDNTIYEEKELRNNKETHKGVWVDIFPLDDVRYEGSIFQTIQANLVNWLKLNIVVQLGYSKPQSYKSRFACSFMRMLNIRKSFEIQEKIMTIWNNKGYNYFVNLGSQYGYKKQTIHKDIFFPPSKLEFEGDCYNAPNDWEFILKRIYGDYMTLPPIEKRINHNPVRIKLDHNC